MTSGGPATRAVSVSDGALRDDAQRFRRTRSTRLAIAMDNEFGYRTRRQTELASLYPGTVVLHDKAVSLRTEDFLDGDLAYRALAPYTILAMGWIVDTIQAFEDGETIFRRVGERMPPSAE